MGQCDGSLVNRAICSLNTSLSIPGALNLCTVEGTVSGASVDGIVSSLGE